MKKNPDNNEEIKETKEKKTPKEWIVDTYNKVKKPVKVAGKVVLGVGITVLAFFAAMAMAENMKQHSEGNDDADILDTPFEVSDGPDGPENPSIED